MKLSEWWGERPEEGRDDQGLVVPTEAEIREAESVTDSLVEQMIKDGKRGTLRVQVTLENGVIVRVERILMDPSDLKH